MERETQADFEGARRAHVALEVRDLGRSIDFYRVLLGREPSVVRRGYAKFEPASPPLNLALNAGPGDPGARPGSSRHFGIEVRSSEEVDALGARLRAAGHDVRAERDTECCYARQDKVWAVDPDGHPWEVFVVLARDVERRAPSSGECCVPGADTASACCGGG